MTVVDAEPPAGTIAAAEFAPAELRQATRNHGMPLEALRYDVTPVGLHYLLIHYDIPALDPQTWTLSVSGHVERPLELTLDDLRSRGRVDREVVLECAGNGRALASPRALSQPWGHEAVGVGRWTGTPLIAVLDEAGLSPDAVEIVFTGADRGVEGGSEQHYARSLHVDDATAGDVLLVHSLNGAPLPPQHGAPLRLLVPGWYGMASVKWLTSIEAVDTPYTGYQQSRAYRFRQTSDEPGEPVTRIAVRALMVPPGIPEFPSRERFLGPGPCRLEGRAWSGWARIEQVEVSADGGGTWWSAEVAQPSDPNGWAPWSTTWEPEGPGTYELVCRATDHTGQTQPLEPSWNLGGYAGNAVQRLQVHVR